MSTSSDEPGARGGDHRSGPRRHDTMRRRRLRGPHDRGMVTVELAIGTGVLALVAVAFAGLVLVLAQQLGCQSAAGEIARQAARGDDAAVRSATAQLPRGAHVRQQRSRSAVRVTVTTVTRPLGPLVPAVHLTASSTVAWEPGEAEDG